MPELEDHRRYVGDAVRLDAFRCALQHVVKAGDVVLDLGAGTAVLSFLACEAGARRVYAVDAGSIVGLARELVRVNGFTDRIHVIREYSEWVQLPEPVDVVVCDQIGRLGVDAGLRQYMIDARRRLARQDAALIPRTIEVWLAPCERRELRSAITFWDTKPAGFSWEPVRNMVRTTAYPASITAGDLIAAPCHLATVDLRRDDGRAIRGSVRMVAERAGTLDALAGWFRAELADNVWITNAPAAERIDRRVTLIPVSPAVAINPGDVITADVRVDTDTTGIAWTLSVATHDGRPVQTMTRSTFEGMLLSAEDLANPRGSNGPRLRRTGTLRKQVLQLCDGQRSRHDIEAALYDYNRDAFATPAEAARFVADVLQQDAE
jgi:hypothetical protein